MPNVPLEFYFIHIFVKGLASFFICIEIERDLGKPHCKQLCVFGDTDWQVPFYFNVAHSLTVIREVEMY